MRRPTWNRFNKNKVNRSLTNQHPCGRWRHTVSSESSLCFRYNWLIMFVTRVSPSTQTFMSRMTSLCGARPCSVVPRDVRKSDLYGTALTASWNVNVGLKEELVVSAGVFRIYTATDILKFTTILPAIFGEFWNISSRYLSQILHRNHTIFRLHDTGYNTIETVNFTRKYFKFVRNNTCLGIHISEISQPDCTIIKLIYWREIYVIWLAGSSLSSS